MSTPERPIDFIAHPYDPRVAIGPDARPSADVLEWSFDAAGVHASGMSLVDRLRSEFGPASTVWGVKATPARELTWEIYWYDDHPNRRLVSFERAAPIFEVSTRFETAPNVDEDLPYVSFSFDLAVRDGELVSSGSTLYFGESADSGRSVGMSYRLDARGARTLANIYQVFPTNRPDEMQLLRRFVSRGAFVHMSQPFDPPWIDTLPCETVILARKPLHDALYFRRCSLGDVTELDEFRFFPAAIAEPLRRLEQSFDHLFFDVGLDYDIVEGSARSRRIGLFGFF